MTGNGNKHFGFDKQSGETSEDYWRFYLVI